MSIIYGPQAATRADANRATMRTAAVNADPAATATDLLAHPRRIRLPQPTQNHQERSANAEREDFEAGG